MVNVWFVLNDYPPDNTLVFLETEASKTVQSHMLHVTPNHIRDKTVVHDQSMKWGSFYLFVAGQLMTSERVLLHGALTLPDTLTNEASDTGRLNMRRSVEMRYTVHVPMETISKAEANQWKK